MNWKFPYLVLFLVMGSILSGPEANSAPSKIVPRVDTSQTNSGKKPMLTEEQIRIAAAEFSPIILFRKISKTEKGIDTRSQKTVFEIEVISATTKKGLNTKTVWDWGSWELDSNFYIMIRKGNGIMSNPTIYLPDSEASAVKDYKELEAVYSATKSKFLSLGSMRAANEGKAEILFAKVLPKGVGKKVSFHILENLSSISLEQISAGVPDSIQLVEGGTYYLAISKSLLGRKVLESKPFSIEESKTLSKLFSARLDFLKEPWSKTYAEP